MVELDARMDSSSQASRVGTTRIGLFVWFCFLLLVPALVWTSVHADLSSSSYSGAAKPMEFLFHYVDEPVRVAGLETKYVMNTLREFRYGTEKAAFSGSLYKPIGLPKIVFSFYLYPNLAGPVTLDGSWQVFVWVNGSAYKPCGFSMEFKEVTVEGQVLWDSGQLSPVVTSSIGGYIDVPVQNYNLSASLKHGFQVGTTLLVSVEVNAGSSAETRIWFDSPLFPSKAILPTKDYARPVDIKTYSYDGSLTNLFYYNWSQSQRVVTVRANVTDPFGGYDVHSVKATIYMDPAKPVVENAEMTRQSDGQWMVHFSGVYGLNWSYPSTAVLGNYTVEVTVIDKNGYYRELQAGSPKPFGERGSHVFTIGIIVFYNPSFKIVDDGGIALPNAQVYVTWPNGTRDAMPRYSSLSGFVNLTSAMQGSYGLTVFWKGWLVNQTSLWMESDGPHVIRCRVYSLTVRVVDNGNASVQGAYAAVYMSDGLGYGVALTDQNGQVVLRLPNGTYDVQVLYSGSYWGSVVTTNETKPSVLVTASGVTTVMLDEYPPPIWTTFGFLMLVVVAVTVAAALVVLFRRRRR